MSNPVLVEVTRGPIVESRHHAAAAVSLASGELVLSIGDVATPVYPRSSAKPFQALAMIAAGGVDRFGLTVEEVCLLCASHNGEERHVRAARSILSKIGLDESALECGAQWPLRAQVAYELARAGGKADAIHHACSGKHSGMLGLARILDVDPRGYGQPDHPVQRRIMKTIEMLCGAPVSEAPCGTDGCSVPTVALPLGAVARGYARLATGEGLPESLADGARRIREAIAAEPFMIAGTGRFCTEAMEHTGARALVKTGAEGVMCAALPERGLGIAVKCDDGATRAAEVVTAHLLAAFGAADAGAPEFARLMNRPIVNPRGIETGVVRAAPALLDALAQGQGAMTA